MMKMKKFFTTLAALLLVASCKHGPVVAGDASQCVTDIQKAMDDYYTLVNDEDPTNDPTSAPVECDLPMAQPGAELTYSVVLRDFSATQEEKMRNALDRAQVVLNSIEFKDRVLNHTYNGQVTFVDNNGQTNAEIYQMIMNGAEKLKPEIDNNMDLDMTLYYKSTSTVGYTYPDTMKVWVNSKFFNGYTLGEVAANAVHEWTHKLGYDHSYYNNTSRPYSVPYGIGKIIRELVDGM